MPTETNTFLENNKMIKIIFNYIRTYFPKSILKMNFGM